MGLLSQLTRQVSPQPIAIHCGDEVIRLMQLDGSPKHSLRNAFEVGADDCGGLKEAIASFRGKRCVVCIDPSEVFVQHIRVEMDAEQQQVISCLQKHDAEWENAEIRSVCVKTTGSGGNMKQELLCVGIERTKLQQIVEKVETSGGRVIAVTVPLYASVRAFDKLYRRDGDEKITSMLIDMSKNSSMVMISHGANCVFAHRIGLRSVHNKDLKEATIESTLLQLAAVPKDEFERRNENTPRGLQETQDSNEDLETEYADELERCLRHHDSLFPDRSVDRIIFTGCGANDTELCAAIASELNLLGYISDPSAWITGAPEYTSGPSWTTVSGLCLHYLEGAA